MRKEAEQRWPCREPGCKGTNYAQISQLHRHCRAKHPDGIVLKHMKTGKRLDQVRRFQADYRLVKVGKDWVDGSAISVQEYPLPDRKLRTGQGKRKREAEQGDAEQNCRCGDSKFCVALVEAYILLLKQPPEDLDATNKVVTQEEALQLLLQIRKGADIKDHLSSNVAAHLSNCKKCNGKLVVQAWKGEVGGNLRGNLYCLYCRTPAMQPILFMEKQELKEVRHMVHACGPISASFKSLKEVGERRPIVREDYYNTSDFLTPKEVLSGLDLSAELEKRIEEKRPTGGQKGVEHALLNEYKRGDYLTCNLQLKPEPSAQAKLLGDLRESQADMEWWADAMEARINDIYQSTLLLIGKADQGTGFHVDWTEAKNIAFACNQADLPKVLAVWIFLHPSIAMKALAWLRINGYPNGFETIGKVHLSEQEVQALDEHLGVDEHGRQYLVRLEQRHGQLVEIPPGWIHQVTNLVECLKMAWDVYELAHVPDYVASWHHISSQVTCSNSEDYMSCRLLIHSALSHSCRASHVGDLSDAEPS
ncbi:TPA: hypothetical protein ACH3X1_015671 [Trebouxia sp. C0004]